MENYFVYIIYSKKLDRFYTGTTDNPQKRLLEHNQSLYTDSFSLRGIPWEMFLIIENLNSYQAYMIEKHIKNMKSKTYINNLKKYPDMVMRLKDKFK